MYQNAFNNMKPFTIKNIIVEIHVSERVHCRKPLKEHMEIKLE